MSSSFKLTDEENELVAKIVHRAATKFPVVENFSDFYFLYDVVGIIKSINRDTGKLENYFLLRCAKGD